MGGPAPFPGARGKPAAVARGGRAAPPRVEHQLYVKVVTLPDVDEKSREITLSALKYFQARMDLLANMGVKLRVNKIRSQDLRNSQLVESMRRRGITRLPALITPDSLHIGLKEIVSLYDSNIEAYHASRAKPGARAAKPAADNLEMFYKNEMTMERAEEDSKEEGIGEGDDMMDSYRRMMERRGGSETSRRPPSAGRPASAPAPGPAPRPQASMRPDNVAPLSAEDAEIQETIGRLARDIDPSLHERAFASGGGDSLEDDGDGDPQDDLMEQAYLMNNFGGIDGMDDDD